MARGRVKKVQAEKVQVPIQADHMVFALDIGTRSLIGMVGTVEENRVKIIAIEKEEHVERAMIDGQIENIEKVAALAGKVKKRLESKIKCELKHVCVAAAGRALRTKRADFELELPGTQLIDDEIISRLEAGAISKAEEAFEAENSSEDVSGRFYLVGYTVCQYFLDQYMISSLKDHRGRQVKVDLIATFLPSEVVESLYTTMHKIGLEVASITLEPIAAINAAIPENLRLLNLVMVDIGAGTSDIAACTNGSVTGYTMATVAGDEVTEAIMKEYLVDFQTAETIKAETEKGEEITFSDILGFERTISRDEVIGCIAGTSELLCREIADKVLEINGGPPSALFLAGGGSKLTGLKDRIREALQMDVNRVAIAGNNFRANAFSDEYDLNNPEYATPLGIAISSGLNMINDSFRVILNDRPAKLFRSGSFTALNLLMMNGYSFQDILGRSGLNLTVVVNGRRKVFYGTAAQPASLFINKKEGKLSDVIHAGDSIDFVPALSGESAKACLGDIEGASICLDITLNGAHAPLKTPLKNGDIIMIRLPDPQPVREDETDGKEDAAEKENTAGAEPAGAEPAGTDGSAEGLKSGAGEPLTAEAAPAAGEEEAFAGTEEKASALSDVGTEERTSTFSDVETEEKASVLSAVGREEKASDFSAGEMPETALEPEAEARFSAVQRAAVGEASEASLEAESKEVSKTPQRAVNGEAPETVPGATGREASGTIPGAVSREMPETVPGQLSKEASAMVQRAEHRELTATASVTGMAISKEEEEKEESIIGKEAEPVIRKTSVAAAAPAARAELVFHLNGSRLYLPRKQDGEPYYLMDMIEYSGIDLKQPKGRVKLTVNGFPGMFQQKLSEGDIILIEEEQ